MALGNRPWEGGGGGWPSRLKEHAGWYLGVRTRSAFEERVLHVAHPDRGKWGVGTRPGLDGAREQQEGLFPSFSVVLLLSPQGVYI